MSDEICVDFIRFSKPGIMLAQGTYMAYLMDVKIEGGVIELLFGIKHKSGKPFSYVERDIHKVNHIFSMVGYPLNSNVNMSCFLLRKKIPVPVIMKRYGKHINPLYELSPKHDWEPVRADFTWSKKEKTVPVSIDVLKEYLDATYHTNPLMSSAAPFKNPREVSEDRVPAFILIKLPDQDVFKKVYNSLDYSFPVDVVKNYFDLEPEDYKKIEAWKKS